MEVLVKPKCCEEEMSFLMDNKQKSLFKCYHCGHLVLQDKCSQEEIRYAEIFTPDELMNHFPHLFRDKS